MDFSFMKSGFDNVNPQPRFSQNQIEEMTLMISLFTSNAMINAARYVELCERDGITKEDLNYGMKYEVFEFLKRGDLEESLKEIKAEFDAKINAEESDFEDEEHEDEVKDINVFKRQDSVDYEKESNQESNEEYNLEMISGETMETMKKIDSLEDMIVDDEDVKDFSRIDDVNYDKLSKEDKEFIDKFHNYYDTWNTWVPETPIENILKDAIEKAY